MVKAVIERLLDGGKTMLSAELEQKVVEITGCHVNTVAAAKKDLGVESYQSGRQWFCRLPGQTTINGEDE